MVYLFSINPNVIIAENVIIGDHVVIESGVYIGAGSIIGDDTVIEKDALINQASRKPNRLHNIKIGKYNRIGRECDLHNGVTLKDFVHLAADCFISGPFCLINSRTTIGEGSSLDGGPIGSDNHIGRDCLLNRISTENNVSLGEYVELGPDINIEANSDIPHCFEWKRPKRALGEKAQLKCETLHTENIDDRALVGIVNSITTQEDDKRVEFIEARAYELEDNKNFKHLFPHLLLPSTLYEYMMQHYLHQKKGELDNLGWSYTPSLSADHITIPISPDETHEECAICLEIETTDKDLPFKLLPCQHRFHRTCLFNWLAEEQPTCPLCRIKPIPLSIQYNDTIFIKDRDTIIEDMKKALPYWCKDLDYE